jgi:hypothetical protein
MEARRVSSDCRTSLFGEVDRDPTPIKVGCFLWVFRFPHDCHDLTEILLSGGKHHNQTKLIPVTFSRRLA